MQVTNHGMTCQISEISFTKPVLCAKNSRIYPSAKVSFCHWDLEESGDSGLPVACWDTQLPKGKTHFFRQRNPRSSQDSSATIASPTAFVTTRCQGEISGSKSTGRKVVSKQRWTFKMRIFLPPCGFITIQNRDDVWNHLENGPQHKSKGYLSLFQAWFVGRRVKNCPITIKQNQGNQWIYDNFSCVSTIFQAPSVFGQSFRETFQNS